jgi:regulator of sigma E protease
MKLPIPALDGGHVMFYCMKLSAENQVISSLRMHKWLVSLLISLLLFANGNDIYKAIV